MKVTLTGPDDLGYWFLHDEDGNAYPLVECWRDHLAAASLFGWTAREEAKDENEMIEDARLWLLEHIADEIEAPKDVVEFFLKLQED